MHLRFNPEVFCESTSKSTGIIVASQEDERRTADDTAGGRESRSAIRCPAIDTTY
jgi:hypothetical protein